MLTLEFLTTTDTTSTLSTNELVEELQGHFSHLTLAVARDAMDMLCVKTGLEGKPKVSREGGNVKAPIRDYPLRWKTPMELVQSTKVLVVVAMGLEYRVVERALKAPYKEVTSCFPKSVATAVVGLIEKCPILVMQTRDYGSYESYAATSSVLFAAREVDEVLKIGTAVYKAIATTDGSKTEVIAVGDVCIMDGSHTRPILTLVKDEYGITKRYTKQSLIFMSKGCSYFLYL